VDGGLDGPIVSSILDDAFDVIDICAVQAVGRPRFLKPALVINVKTLVQFRADSNCILTASENFCGTVGGIADADELTVAPLPNICDQAVTEFQTDGWDKVRV